MTTAAQQRSSDFWLAVERFADTMRNWDLSRPYTSLLSERREGFTERFGSTPSTADAGDASILDNECWQREMESAELICATEHPAAPSIRVVQYRAAWMEQLALCIAGLPHVVVNSSYAVTECTGPLPYLQDFSGASVTSSSSSSNKASPPAMTGRRNHHQYTPGADSTDVTATTKSISTGNAILDYLAYSHGLNLDQPLISSKPKQHQAQVYKTLIRQHLEPCRILLQFQDEGAWKQIHRERCLLAGGGRWWAVFQARSERIYETSRLSTEYRALSTQAAIQQVRSAYQVLESALQQQPQSAFLMGTGTPTLVDVMLWDHLMHALADVHLAVILADFPALVRFVQRIWDIYFVVDADKDPDWKVWNAQQNASNVFCQVPSLVADDPQNLLSPPPSHFHDAIDLMEQLSVRERNLGESLLLAKEALSLQKVRPTGRPFDTWHRWRMGGGLYPPDQKKSHVDASRPDLACQQEEKTRKEYKRNDELWMVTVGVGTALTILLVGLARPQ